MNEWMDNGDYTMIDYEKELIEINKPVQERYKKEMFGKEQWLPISDIKVDIAVQRDLQEHHVQKIVRKFDPTAFGRLMVTQREDGNYYCTDGQHRLRALETLGFDYAPCVVIQLCSLKDEGLNFINVNEQSAKVSNIDKYRIGVSSEIAGWLAVKECIDFIGGKVGTGDECVSCVGVIYKHINNSKLETSRQRDIDIMKKTLLVLQKLYGMKGINDKMVKSMAYFIKVHVYENDDTTTSEILEKLKGSNYKDFLSRAQDMRENNAKRGKIVSYIAFLIYTEYNNKLKKNRLPLRINI